MALLQVKTECGLIQGLPSANQAISVFKGIPFAAPPVGELRWKDPQPPKAWSGTLEAYKFAPIPWQVRMMSEGGGAVNTSEFYVIEHERSEDCLYLNVWTPAKSTDEKLPVGVYFHGGGHNTGYSYLQAYDGDGFAKRGIVFVTIGYRLNVFGFLAHPLLSAESPHKTSGNYGTLDQVAGVEWVKRNIAAFGGDPDNITIFGQSGGGSSVQQLSITPLAKGLFKRAIMQSGGGFRGPRNIWDASLTKAEELGQMFFKYMGFNNLTEARALAAEDVLNGMARFCGDKVIWAGDDSKGPDGMPPFRFNVIVDGYVQPYDTVAMLKDGKHHDVDYMIGCTANESEGAVIQSVGWCENELIIGRKPSYMYYFTYVPPGAEKIGAHHSVEHHFVFQTFVRSKRAYGAFDFDLSNELADYWANFIKTGNPNPKGSDLWQKYTKEAPMALNIGKERKMTKVPMSDSMLKEMNQRLGR